jgi:hypothetical protein
MVTPVDLVEVYYDSGWIPPRLRIRTSNSNFDGIGMWTMILVLEYARARATGTANGILFRHREAIHDYWQTHNAWAVDYERKKEHHWRRRPDFWLPGGNLGNLVIKSFGQ